MKSKFFFIALLVCFESTAQLRGTLEQIYYYDRDGGFAMGPLAQLQTKDNWFLEARYNYEEARSVSFYVGKAYENTSEFSYSIVPMFGGVVGRFKGGSAAINLDLEYKDLYFSSQSQYTFSVQDEVDNFYFTWSELGYQPLDWFYGGVALQETYYPQIKEHVTHPGVVLGFAYKRWTLPLYGFRTARTSAAFVCSIVYEW
jgi:hypothetical protein